MDCCIKMQPEPELTPNLDEKPLVRMCAPGSHVGFSNFVDIGDTVVLFVDFGPKCQPMPQREDHPMGGATAGYAWPGDTGQYEVKLAGLQAFLKRIKPKDKDCMSFRTEATVLMTEEVLENPGQLVKFIVPYIYNNEQAERQEIREVTEKDITDDNHKVYHHALWNELVGYNKGVRDELRHRTSTYGSMGHSTPLGGRDLVDAGGSGNYLASEERAPLLTVEPRARRLWPDSWEMSYWRSCCDPVLRPNNCFTRFVGMFFVTPLTNLTGLSLYYQLYLSEIFHSRFWTRMGHYFFMPMIVMMMLSFFAQWRFYGCYTFINTEVLVLNGALVLAGLFLLWYVIWGIVQETYFMGVFMILPMTVLYILANIIFQMSVKNTPGNNFPCNHCWSHNVYLNGNIQFYNSFKLMAWYYNPVLWVSVLCFGQALSHIFEPKLPPRVNQTAHWLSCADFFKRNRCTKSLFLLCLQTVFGTVDELLASPRLLPLLILRVCYTLGHQPKQWELLKILVKKSIQFGDPALDYIGTGGAEYLPEDSVIPENSVTDVNPDPEQEGRPDKGIGTHIGELKRRLRELELTLTEENKAALADPDLLRKLKEDNNVDASLEHFIVVRHYVAKYDLQLHAYGPFRIKTDDSEEAVSLDNKRMERDFPAKHHGSFQNFLKQARFFLWIMEDNIITRRASSATCCPTEV